jgi:adenylosuccinate lyase
VIPDLTSSWSSSDDAKVRSVLENFTEEDATSVKNEGLLIHSLFKRAHFLERVTNHDVKAVEYFIKKKFDALGLSKFKEYIHFALTSQDINNTAIPLSLKVCSYRSTGVHIIHSLGISVERVSSFTRQCPEYVV